MSKTPFIKFLAILLFASPVFAVVDGRLVELKPVKDTTIYSPTGGITLNDVTEGTVDIEGRANALGDYLFAGSTGQGRVTRSLLQFDLSFIPSGSIITGVMLSLHANTPLTGAGFDVNLHSVLSEWTIGTSDAGPFGAGGEGGGGDPTPNDATWNSSSLGNSVWNTPGGDFSLTASATTFVEGPGIYDWTSPQMVVDVQGWLDDPITNKGWLLKADNDQDGSARRFASGDNDRLGDEHLLCPTLTVTYEIPEPMTLSLLGLGGLGLLCRRRT